MWKIWLVLINLVAAASRPSRGQRKLSLNFCLRRQTSSTKRTINPKDLMWFCFASDGRISVKRYRRFDWYKPFYFLTLDHFFPSPCFVQRSISLLSCTCFCHPVFMKSRFSLCFFSPFFTWSVPDMNNWHNEIFYKPHLGSFSRCKAEKLDK